MDLDFLGLFLKDQNNPKLLDPSYKTDQDFLGGKNL